MISFVCCYNNKTEYDAMAASLGEHSGAVKYELLGVDNTLNRFNSMAEALNYGAESAKGNLLVFLHQDIRFRQGGPENLFTAALSLGKGDWLLGLFGASAHGECTKEAGLTETENLDECFICVPKDVCRKYRFNEELCNGWHLYAVELCIRVRRQGGKIYKGAFAIDHLSNGTVNESYMQTFKKLISEYKDEGQIATTCKSMPTNLLYFEIYHFFWKIKKTVFGNYPLLYKIRVKMNEITEKDK